MSFLTNVVITEAIPLRFSEVVYYASLIQCGSLYREVFIPLPEDDFLCLLQITWSVTFPPDIVRSHT